MNRLGPGERTIEALAVTHHRFEQIHPFLDGNGRTGRLLLNLVLARLGYAPAIVYKRDRITYLQALRKADTDDPGPLDEILARAVLDNLYRFIAPAVAGPHRLVPLPALATRDLTEGALRAAFPHICLPCLERTPASVSHSSFTPLGDGVRPPVEGPDWGCSLTAGVP